METNEFSVTFQVFSASQSSSPSLSSAQSSAVLQEVCELLEKLKSLVNLLFFESYELKVCLFLDAEGKCSIGAAL